MSVPAMVPAAGSRPPCCTTACRQRKSPYVTT